MILDGLFYSWLAQEVLQSNTLELAFLFQKELGTAVTFADTTLLQTDASTDRVGVGVAAPNGKLHVKQASATGAQPVIEIEQLDQDYAFINYVGTSATDGTKSLSSSSATAFEILYLCPYTLNVVRHC